MLKGSERAYGAVQTLLEWNGIDEQSLGQSWNIRGCGHLAVRLVWPTVTIDGITIGLFVVALIPWLTSIVESLKLPGGWEIKLRDVSEAGQRITDAIPSAAENETPSLLAVADQDPNLALVGLRIEIEKRLRMLAESANISSNQPLSRLLFELQKRGVLNHSAFSGLQEIVMAGNQAAHGARVEPGLSDWAFSKGNVVLSALDSVLQDRNKQQP